MEKGGEGFSGEVAGMSCIVSITQQWRGGAARCQNGCFAASSHSQSTAEWERAKKVGGKGCINHTSSRQSPLLRAGPEPADGAMIISPSCSSSDRKQLGVKHRVAQS